MQQEGAHVARVHLAGVIRNGAGQIEPSDDGHSMLNDDLSRTSELAIAAARRSSAEATAPSLRAVAIACKPATPAPITKTRPGVIVPAAVVSIGKMRGEVSAASTTAL